MHEERVHAVVVNHNTSPFTELTLRSVVADTVDHDDLVVTVVDNHSDDEGLEALRAAADEVGAKFERSRWPAGATPHTTHGDVLRDFVLAHLDDSYFLFLDCDVVFVNEGTVERMREALRVRQDDWATVPVLLPAGLAARANLHTFLAKRGADSAPPQLVKLEGTLTYPLRFGALESATLPPHESFAWPRPQAACMLIRNSDAFQLVARHVGFATCWSWANDTDIGGFGNTMALAARAMATHGQGYSRNGEVVMHFGKVTSSPTRHDSSVAERDERLSRLRASGTGSASIGRT